jgi:hypothetical protein
MLSYQEDYEQASWVLHLLKSEAAKGMNPARMNLWLTLKYLLVRQLLRITPDRYDRGHPLLVILNMITNCKMRPFTCPI